MSSTSRRQVLRTAAAGTAAALAGCVVLGPIGAGSDGPGAPTADGSGELGDPAPAVTVAVQSLPRPSLEPGLVHIDPGGTVTWQGGGQRNAVAAYHPKTHGPQRIPDGAEPWASGVLRAGNEFEVTFPTAGIYDYADTTEACGSHESIGLVGRVVVGRPDLAGQPALEHDPDELPSRAATVMQELNEWCREVLDHD